MRTRFILILLLAELLFWFQTAVANAHPVISEVMWAGSDLSSSDEWLELALPDTDDVTDISGWTINYLKSTGLEGVMITFPEGTKVSPGEFFVVSHNHADASRLLHEPAFVTTAVTLANTGLRLRLKDAAGFVIDEVDDGVGVPFAGANPTSPSLKTSMERIDLLQAGTLKENWRSATIFLGLDDGALMMATPGFAGTSPDSSSSSSSSSCASDFIPEIILQSGAFQGVGTVTLNVQAGAASGTLVGVTCRFDFGDGFTSNSCNPGVHTYDIAGTYSLSLQAVNQCGNTLTQSQIVTVQPLSGQTSVARSASSSMTSVFDGSHVLISGVLPNPDATDRDKEWIELKNLEDRTVSLVGWVVQTGKTKTHRYPLDALPPLGPHEVRRLYQLETGIEFSNASDVVELRNPNGEIVSSVHWDKATEQRVYLSDFFKNSRITGTVSHLFDSVLFDFVPDGPSALLLGSDHVFVQLLGIQPMESQITQEQQGVFTSRMETLRALIENKKVELFFDTDVWTEDAVLFAAVMADDGRIVQKDLLLSGLASIDPSQNFRLRETYQEAQKEAMKRHAGLWKFSEISDVSSSTIAVTSENKSVHILSSAQTSTGTLWPIVGISEVFSSPDSAVSKQNSGSLLGVEWLEFYSENSSEIPLEGWTLTIGSKTVTFGSKSILFPDKYIVLLTQKIGLKLKNTGDDIQLRSPDGSVISTVTYPKLNIGQSFVWDAGTDSYCVSKIPSPGQAGSCSVLASATGKKPKNTGKKTVRKSVYDRYAADYERTVAEGDTGDIVLHSRQKSLSWSLLVLLGIVVGIAFSALTVALKSIFDARKT